MERTQHEVDLLERINEVGEYILNNFHYYGENREHYSAMLTKPEFVLDEVMDLLYQYADLRNS
jgi:hypothetical protein